MRFLEIFKSSYFADVSLDQWMTLAPPELVEVHLKLDQQVMDALRKNKAPVVPIITSRAFAYAATRVKQLSNEHRLLQGACGTS